MSLVSPLRGFSINAILLNIGGVPISGFGDGDVITFDPVPQGEMVSGSDGLTVFCYKNQSWKGVKIKLMQHSKAYTVLMGLLDTQKALFKSSSALLPTPFSYVDPSTGTFVTSAYTVFLEIPGFSVGEQPGHVEFSIAIGTPLESRGTLNYA